MQHADELPPASSGTPSIARMPFSHRIGFATVVESTRSSAMGRLPAAMRPAKPRPERHAHGLTDLFFEPARRRGHQLAGALVEEQDRGGVRVDDRANPAQELLQELLHVEPPQGRVRDRLEVLQPPESAAGAVLHRDLAPRRPRRR